MSEIELRGDSLRIDGKSLQKVRLADSYCLVNHRGSQRRFLNYSPSELGLRHVAVMADKKSRSLSLT